MFANKLKYYLVYLNPTKFYPHLYNLYYIYFAEKSYLSEVSNYYYIQP